MKTTHAALSAICFAVSVAGVSTAQARRQSPAASPWHSAASRSVNTDVGPVPRDAYPTFGWNTRTPMPSARWAHAMASSTAGTWPDNDAYVYVISGSDSSFNNTSALSRYDVRNTLWTDLAPMTPSRTQISAVRVGGKLYVPGGYGGAFAPTNVLSIYDIPSNTWSAGHTMPQATGDYAIGAYADRYVYVIGGYSGSVDLNNVQVYDTQTDTWTNATPKAGTAVAGLRGGIAGNQILVVGGYSQNLASQLAEVRRGLIGSDPNSITWTTEANYPGGPAGRLGAGQPVAAGPALGAAALDILLFTGGDPNGQGDSVKNDTWIYDFNANAWRSGPPKPTGISNIENLAGVASGGQLHIVSTGGYNGSSVTTVNEWLTLGDEAASDLSLSINADTMTVEPGEGIVYTLAYVAAGPGAATAVILDETIPAGTHFDVAHSAAGWSCSPDDGPGSHCLYSIGTVAIHGSGSVLFAVTTDYPVPDNLLQIDDVATISGGKIYGTEANLGNNLGTAATPFATGDVQISPVTGLATNESGKTADFDVVLAVPPSSEVTLDFVSDTPSEGVPSPTSLVFTSANWNQARTVTVTGVNDFVDDGDVAYSITGSVRAGSGNYTGASVPSVMLVNIQPTLDRLFADGFDVAQ